MRASAGRLAACVVASALVAVAVPAPSAAHEDAGPVRLLVTYAAPVDGDAEGLELAAASVVGDVGQASTVQVLEFDRARDARDAARGLSGRPDVVAVEPDQPLYPDGKVERVLDTVVRSGEVEASGDPHLDAASSWGIRNEGHLVGGIRGHAGIDVGAEELRSRTTGRGIVVAVIDTGVDVHHPLLRDRIWRNPAESKDGRDTDGNGYVDDLHGWDFVNHRPNVFASADLDAHGTHVAGIVSGAAHPDSGFVSAAPDATIMPLKVIEGSEGRVSDAISAIRYAEANGADVINASWGGPDPSTALRTALAETRIPVVVAAGNLGTSPGSPPSYPAAYGLPNVISVAAIDAAGAMPSFSSRSRDVIDVVAPGHHVLSTWPSSRLAVASGTSSAAPHVAGLVALALQRHPEQGPVELSAAVRNSVRPLGAADPTRSGGLARGPGLLDHLGTEVPACGSLPSVPFVDVTPGGAHHDAVACMLELGVTQGTTSTTYGSERGLTRAQIATMLVGALAGSERLPPVPATGRFDDVAATNVHRDNIERLASVDIVRGSTATRYEPDRTVTRAEFAATVARAAEWVAQGEVRAEGPTFDDTAGHADLDGIRKASGLRIVTGRSAGVFDPDVPLRRDQAASMVTRLLDRLVQQGLIDAA